MISKFDYRLYPYVTFLNFNSLPTFAFMNGKLKLMNIAYKYIMLKTCFFFILYLIFRKKYR